MPYSRYVDYLDYKIFQNISGAYIMPEVSVAWLLARDKEHFYRKLSHRFGKTISTKLTIDRILIKEIIFI